MNTRRTLSRIVQENDANEDLPPQLEQVLQSDQGDQGAQGSQGDQVPIVGGVNDVLVVPSETTNGEIGEALLILARALTTHVYRGIE